MRRQRVKEPIDENNLSDKIDEAFASKGVGDGGRELADILEKEEVPKTRAVVFESANAPKGVEISDGMQRIVETIFIPTDKVFETYKKLESDLVLGNERRVQKGHIIAALDNAESNLRLANRLYLSAKLDFEAWEKDHEIVTAPIKQEANRALQREKNEGSRSKQITDGDLASMCALLFPEEWKDAEIKRARFKATVDSLANLQAAWDHRCQTLRKLHG